jgi:hypothetical protein
MENCSALQNEKMGKSWKAFKKIPNKERRNLYSKAWQLLLRTSCFLLLVVCFVCSWELNHCVGDQDKVVSLPPLAQTAASRLRSYPRGFPSIPTRGFFVQLPTMAATSPAPGTSSTKR